MRHLAQGGIETLGVSSAQLDLCSPGAAALLAQILRPTDAVVVASALTPDKGKDAGTLMKNVTMGQRLNECFSRSSCTQVVYLSSDAVYADEVTPVRETSPASPTTFHGLMHLVRERMLIQALAPSHTPLVILRPCALYGPHDPHNGYGPNRFLRSALRERTITLFGQGEEQRDHVYIEDLSRLIGLCLQHHSEGVVNVATGRSVSFAALAQQVAALCGEPVQIHTLARQTPVTHRHVDISALVRAFPAFRPTPLAEGLTETLKTMAEEAAEV
jgi:nucleoside-diphosphate-sugar epimerase